MLLGHSFELRSNSRAFAIAGSVMTSGLLINECSQQKKSQFDEGKQDLLVQKFGLRRPQRQLNARDSFLLLYQEKTKGDAAQRVM